jgi:hypothetical protein
VEATKKQLLIKQKAASGTPKVLTERQSRNSSWLVVTPLPDPLPNVGLATIGFADSADAEREKIFLVDDDLGLQPRLSYCRPSALG